jgi:hypothetical protein
MGLFLDGRGVKSANLLLVRLWQIRAAITPTPHTIAIYAAKNGYSDD